MHYLRRIITNRLGYCFALLLSIVNPIIADSFSFPLDEASSVLSIIEDDAGRLYPGFFGFHNSILVVPNSKNNEILYFYETRIVDKITVSPNIINPRVNYFKVLENSEILVLVDQIFYKIDSKGSIQWTQKLPLTFFVDAVYSTSDYVFVGAKDPSSKAFYVWDIESGTFLGTFGSAVERLIQTDSGRIIPQDREIDGIPLVYISTDSDENDYWYVYRGQRNPVIYKISHSSDDEVIIERTLQSSDSGSIYFAFNKQEELYYSRITNNNLLIDKIEFE